MHYFFSTFCFQFTSQSYLVCKMTKIPFFSIIFAWTNVYTFSPERNWGRSYGHDFQSVLEDDLVWWCGVLIQDGAKGSTGDAIHRRWMMNDVDHDDCIINAMPYSCWIKIKSVLKLNHNDMTPKQLTPTTIHVPNMPIFSIQQCTT